MIFYKTWWDEKLDQLISGSMNARMVWWNGGSPRYGPLFNEMKHKLAFKLASWKKEVDMSNWQLF